MTITQLKEEIKFQKENINLINNSYKITLSRSIWTEEEREAFKKSRDEDIQYHKNLIKEINEKIKSML